jgi:hypothetical protein
MLVDDVPKRASNVVELTETTVSFPENAWRVYARGEGLYLDLGPGRPPLVSLLATIDKDSSVRDTYGPRHMARALNVKRLWDYKIDRDLGLEAVLAVRRAIELPVDLLPQFVTFGDVNDPASAIWVDMSVPAATLGAGVKLARATIELTDEKITSGLEQRLPWLTGIRDRQTNLEGRQSTKIANKDAPNWLTHYEFIRDGN